MGEKKLEYTSIADYLTFERESEFKHEYRDGEIIPVQQAEPNVEAMAGGTINHGIIGKNMMIALDKRTEKSGCHTFNNDIKIFIDKTYSFVYPDVYVVCGEIETAEFDEDSIINPVLVVEVLSKSTEAYDRGEKFRKYCSLPSFKEYILITQDEPLVEIFYKKDEKTWIMTTVIGLDKTVSLQSIDAEIPMQEIYRNITKWKDTAK